MRLILLIAATAAATLFSGDAPRAQTAANFCQTKPTRQDALDWPEKHAWNLFIWLNHPAIDEAIRRGVPDCSKPIGAPGTTAVWETWRNAATEVFRPQEPPEWDDNSLPDEKPGSVPPDGFSLMGAKPQQLTAFEAEAPMVSFHGLRGVSEAGPFFSPEDGVFDKSGGFGETRINKSTYDFIRNNCLYNRQGTERYAKAIIENKKNQITLPVDSIEVKAAWIDFEKECAKQEKTHCVQAGNRSRYYTANYKGKRYGLIALHFLTKDIPNWFWASFHHVDSPPNKWHLPDTFGRPKLLNGTVWENYLLSGAQVDFVTPTGKPTILSDYYVEFGFQKSSCITCHSTASIARSSAPRRVGMPFGQSRAVCLLDPKQPPFSEPSFCKQWAGAHLFKPNSDDLIEERGSPLPEWWIKDGNVAYFQTDFLYSSRSGQAKSKSRVQFLIVANGNGELHAC